MGVKFESFEASLFETLEEEGVAVLSLVVLLALLLYTKLPCLEQDSLAFVGLPLSYYSHKELLLCLVLAQDQLFLLLTLEVLFVEALNSQRFFPLHYIYTALKLVCVFQLKHLDFAHYVLLKVYVDLLNMPLDLGELVVSCAWRCNLLDWNFLYCD